MAKAKQEFLTKEQLIAKIAESRAALDDLVSKFNAAESAADIQKIEDAIKDGKKQHNEYQQSLVLTECLDSQNPTLEACRRSVCPCVVTKTTKHENGTRTMAIESSTDLLDLTRFAKTITNPWRYKAELLCLFQTKETAASIGRSDKDFQDDLVRFFKLSEDARKAPKASKRSTTTIIKEVVSAMIGEEYGKMVVAADVNKFVCGFTQDNKRNRTEIMTGNFRQTVKLLTDICHRILTEGQYAVRTKQLTKDGKAWADGGFRHQEPAPVIASGKIADDADSGKDGAPAKKKSGAVSEKKSAAPAKKAPAEKKSASRRSGSAKSDIK